MAAAAGGAEAPLCAYELERLERIKRNRKVMEALGLFDEDVALAAQMRAAEGAKSGGSGGRKGRKRPAADTPPAEPSRRSQRVAGLGSDGASLDSLQPRDAIRVRQLDHLHAGEAEHYDTRHAGAQRRASVVGTASYRHTLMRVRTMGEDALARRITAIERAKGKFAVIKMRLFARVLFLEEYESLAQDAAEALGRLIAVLGDVVSDEDADEADEAARDNAAAAALAVKEE